MKRSTRVVAGSRLRSNTELSASLLTTKGAGNPGALRCFRVWPECVLVGMTVVGMTVTGFFVFLLGLFHHKGLGGEQHGGNGGGVLQR